MLQAMWTVTPKDDQDLLHIKSDAVLDYRSLQDLLRQIYVDDKDKYVPILT